MSADKNRGFIEAFVGIREGLGEFVLSNLSGPPNSIILSRQICKCFEAPKQSTLESLYQYCCLRWYSCQSDTYGGILTLVSSLFSMNSSLIFKTGKLSLWLHQCKLAWLSTREWKIHCSPRSRTSLALHVICLASLSWITTLYPNC